MKMTFEQLINRKYEQFFTSENRKMCEQNINKDYCKININTYNTGFGVIYNKFQATFFNDIFIIGKTDFDTSNIIFNIGNSNSLNSVKDKRIYEFSKNEINAVIQKNGSLSNNIFEKNKTYEYLIITIEDSLFDKFCNHNNHSEDYLEILFTSKINPLQQNLIYQIKNINILEDNLKNLFLESKLLELVYATFKNNINLSKEINLNESDMQMLRKAKEILLDNVQNPPSIKSLAHLCSTNEFKLKLGFKKLYKTTIYGMLNDQRLEIAKQLLVNNDISIKEAAFLVGYKSMSHFSKIFKDKFKSSPSKIKQDIKFYIK